eukprot:gene32689-55340_t
MKQRVREYKTLRDRYVRELEEYGSPYGRGFVALQNEVRDRGYQTLYAE